MPTPKTEKRFQVLTCDCQGTSPLDRRSIEAAAGTALDTCGTQLCRHQIDRFKSALDSDQPLLVGCTQEAPLFLEVADDAGFGGDLRFVNIREKAGWSSQAHEAGAKMGALIAEAMLDIAGPRTVTMTSAGVVLIIGRDEVALDAAQQLASRMDVTLLLVEENDIAPPRIAEFPIFRGTPRETRGHLGAFEIEIANYAPAVPAARDRIVFEQTAAPRAQSQCDVILDLRGATPLVPAPQKRDGYFNPDPRNPAAVARALFEISNLIGEFEKPRYVEYEQAICAHSRNGIVACTRCLDNCPTGAIVPKGDGVDIDAYICAGCGNCAGVCPTGAVRYAMPESESVLQRLQTLLKAYGAGGGSRAVLLVHDGEYGEDMIATIARHADGLPANVLPVAVNSVGQCGIETMAAARVFGATRTLILVPPGLDDDLAALDETAALSNLIMTTLGYRNGAVEIVTERDPEALADLLRAAANGAEDGPPAEAFSPFGRKRELLSLSLAALYRAAPKPVDEMALPQGAPFGTLDIDVPNCTLCMSCVGVCPANALRDTADHPRLSFVESACVQCGLCAKTCPEKVITLRPRLDFTGAAQNARIIKEEEPFECVRCGKPFATKSMIAVIQTRMRSHSMFGNDQALRRLMMCGDCRVIDMAESVDDPFKSKPRAAPRTTDDYLRERELGIKDDDGENS